MGSPDHRAGTSSRAVQECLGWTFDALSRKPISRDGRGTHRFPAARGRPVFSLQWPVVRISSDCKQPPLAGWAEARAA